MPLCQVYIWGGGKSSPQTLATFKKDLGAVKVCVAPKHFCVVTVEKELYAWSSGEIIRKFTKLIIRVLFYKVISILKLIENFAEIRQ